MASELQGETFLAVKGRSRELEVGLTLRPETAAPRLSDNEGQFNWARMTKVVRVSSGADLDEALLDLVSEARMHAARPRRSSYFGVTLRDLIDAGLLSPGTELVLVAKERRDVAHATLTDAGEILWQGRTHRSPSDMVFAPLLGVTKFNGWAYWHA